VAYLGFQKGARCQKGGVWQGYPLITEGCSPPHWEGVWGGGLASPSPPKYATVNKCEIKTEITTDSHKSLLLVTGQA